MPPLVVAALGVAGAVAAGTWIVKEVRRVNAILHPPEPEPAPEQVGASVSDEKRSRLRRDSAGVYRPE